MRQRMWTRLMAAAAGAIALAGSASAQYQASPAPIAIPIVGAQPAPGPTAPSIPAPMPNLPPGAAIVPDGAIAKSHAIGTGHLATAARGFVMQSTGQYYCSNCATGDRCNNGAGSLSSDIGFMFGPTKSFFAPCGPRVLPDCGGRFGAHGANCRSPIYGRGPSGPYSHCNYDSYMNH